MLQAPQIRAALNYNLYATGLKAIEAHQTVALDVRQLRDNQVLDTAGRAIPFDATHGQIRWSLHGTKNLVLIGRVEQVDVAKGIASSYACQNCCPSTFNDERIEITVPR